MKVHKITVCGGGNGAQTLVPIAAHNLGCPVNVYAPFADEAERLCAGVAIHGGLEVTGAVRTKAWPRRVSADAAQVIPGSDVVVLVLPAFAHESTLQEIAPFLDEGAWVGAMPARGGFDYCAAQVLAEQGRDDVGLFGLQTLPWACRIREYGQVVHVLGVKDAVDAAARPAARIGQIAPLLERMLGLPIGAAPNMLALTLANTGQLVHPGIMYSLFTGWDGVPFSADAVPLFYQGLDEQGAQTLSGLSDDVQAIRARLEPALDLSAVRPLKTWLLRSYGDAIADPSTLRSAFVTNRAYAGLKAPVREVAPGQFVPDFHARYLAEDVPFGLVVSRAIAGLAGVETPMIDEVIAWAGARLGKDYLGRDGGEARIPQKYGLGNLEALIAFATET
ncbi:MAG: NAD/NADP octopine/nopaline dehydrogenase family protein [Anaerolineae bacterium]